MQSMYALGNMQDTYIHTYTYTYTHTHTYICMYVPMYKRYLAKHFLKRLTKRDKTDIELEFATGAREAANTCL